MQVEEQHALKPQANILTGSNKVSERVLKSEAPQSHNLGKRKRGNVIAAHSDPKLKEYLEVMQPPSKSKTWLDEDSAGTPNVSEIVKQDLTHKVEAGHSDEEYETVPKKRKVPKESEEMDELERSAANASDTVRAIGQIRGDSKEAVDVNSPESVSRKVSEPPSDAVPAASDEDWLRSRTSRLLGLVDDDDALQWRPSPQAIVEVTEDPAVSKQPQWRKMPDTSAQTDEETNTPILEAAERTVTDKEGTDQSTGRLFVRNLLYTTTEHDIRGHFEAQNYGFIEEVGLHSLLL